HAQPRLLLASQRVKERRRKQPRTNRYNVEQRPQPKIEQIKPGSVPRQRPHSFSRSHCTHLLYELASWQVGRLKVVNLSTCQLANLIPAPLPNLSSANS